MSAPDPVRVLTELGGVATHAQLRTTFSPEELRNAVVSGGVRRIARGRYATHDADAAVVAARSVSGVLAELSAAQWWGWAVKRPPVSTVVVVPRNRSRAKRVEGLTVRRRDLAPGAVVDGIVTSRAQTVVDCARSLPFDEALAVADSALRDPEVTRDQLLVAMESSPRSGRDHVRRVVVNAHEDAANPFESCVRAASLEVDGLSLVPQVEIPGVGWPDLVDTTLRIVVECDSWAYHSGEDQFRHDVRRYTDLVAKDWLVVRFVWEDAMVRQDRIRDVLTKVVALRRRSASGAG